jgi:hypothetical protein
MAKQAGAIKITGTIDNTCFYKLEGDSYARSKSTLSGKRVKNDKAFKKTMAYAQLLAESSKIASELYKTVSKEKKSRKVYREIVGKVMINLKKKRGRLRSGDALQYVVHPSNVCIFTTDAS